MLLYRGRMIETDVSSGGRTLHAYAHGDGDRVVMWHHGTPNIGTPPAPLFAAAERLGVRFVAYDRPGYGGSAPRPDRDIASAATDAAAVADALGVGEFAVLGHSGGGPHALACAALLPGRVTAAVAIAGLAPYPPAGPASGGAAAQRATTGPGHDAVAMDAAAGSRAAGVGRPVAARDTGTVDGVGAGRAATDAGGEFDWFAGMGPGGVASLRAAVAGRAAKQVWTADPAITEPDFTADDWAALTGEWGWFGSVVEPAVAAGPAPLIDDDLAYVRPWGFDPATITAPVLLVHGEADLMVPCTHSVRLAATIAGAELRLVPRAGHISVLAAQAVPALEWIAARRGRRMAGRAGARTCRTR